MTLSAGLERAIGLLDPARRPKSAAVPDGYLDLLGGAGRRGGGPAQRLMLTRGLPVVYERWWRPAWGRVLMGPLGPGTTGELRGEPAQDGQRTLPSLGDDELPHYAEGPTPG